MSTAGFEQFVGFGRKSGWGRRPDIPKDVCVKYLMQAYEAVGAEVERLASLPSPVHNRKINLSNIYVQETWRNGDLKSITAKFRDWSEWDPVSEGSEPATLGAKATDYLSNTVPYSITGFCELGQAL